jgi:hypothetical protein
MLSAVACIPVQVMTEAALSIAERSAEDAGVRP